MAGVFCFGTIRHMQMNNKNIALFVLLIIATVAIIFFVSKDKTDNKTGEFTINQISTSTEVKIGGGNSEEKTVVKTIAIPSLDRVVTADTLQADLRNQLISQIKETSATLKNNTGYFDGWIMLGSLRKMAGDYEGARDAWEYASAISPSNYVSFGNLGDLYQYYLKDYPRAEKNMLTSVKNKVDNIAGYRNLYNLYTQSYKKKISEAPKILLLGLSKNPNNLDLIVLLAQYYAGVGDKSSATKYYELGITQADKEGNVSLKQSLLSELSALR